MKSKHLLQPVIYAAPLLVIVFILFYGYTVQNKHRIAEQNRNYAEDAARQAARQVADEFKDGQSMINTYAHFFNEHFVAQYTFEIVSGKTVISTGLLREMENNSIFDTVRFTDVDGVTYTSDGMITD